MSWWFNISNVMVKVILMVNFVIIGMYWLCPWWKNVVWFWITFIVVCYSYMRIMLWCRPYVVLNPWLTLGCLGWSTQTNIRLGGDWHHCAWKFGSIDPNKDNIGGGMTPFYNKVWVNHPKPCCVFWILNRFPCWVWVVSLYLLVLRVLCNACAQRIQCLCIVYASNLLIIDKWPIYNLPMVSTIYRTLSHWTCPFHDINPESLGFFVLEPD